MATLRDIVVDCRHPARLARFWAAVLDDYEVAPYDDAERARLRGLGIEDPEDDPTVLVRPEASGPRLWFQRVPEHKERKNRLHLDLAARAGGFQAELERLESLGATRAPDQHNPDLVVLRDLEDNEFCLLR